MSAASSTSSCRPGAPPTKIILPDLVSHCTFEIRVNRHRKQASAESKKWLFRGDNLNGKNRDAYHGLKAGLLTSMCYPDAGCPQLRVCCDFMNYLFHLDNLSDDMDTRGTRNIADTILNSLYHPYTFESPARLSRMTKDYWRRLILTASAGAQQRFIETFDFFFQAVSQQALDRAHKVIPDLESYISMRRDTSGCKPCWALIEYANNLDIPDEVMEHPIICALGEAANDLVTWSNDIFSYNVEQSKGDTHNMIPVVMHQNSLDLQSAVNFVGDLCKQSIDRFNHERSHLPSWGPKIDKDVAVYVDGLANWICGSLHWSFESERYFGTNGKEVKAARVVNLLPPRVPIDAAGPLSPSKPSKLLSSKTEKSNTASTAPQLAKPLRRTEPTPIVSSPAVTVPAAVILSPRPPLPLVLSLPPIPSPVASLTVLPTIESSPVRSPICAYAHPPSSLQANSHPNLRTIISWLFYPLMWMFSYLFRISYDTPTLILLSFLLLSRCIHAVSDIPLSSLAFP